MMLAVFSSAASELGESQTIEGVGLDLDGTLFDHQSAAKKAIQALAAEFDWPEDLACSAWFTAERIHFDQYTSGLITFAEQRR